MAALFALLLACSRDERFDEVSSRPGPGPGDERVLVHARLPFGEPSFLQSAEAYAVRRAPDARNVAVHFFAGLPAAQIGNEFEAQLTYCVHRDGRRSAWMPGGGDCFPPRTTKGAAPS